VVASLLTGEERDIVPGARHVACAVEMADTNRIINVAFIDEAQMLADPDRGAAWTAAVMGVPAREVIVLGAPDCLPLVRRIAELCDEPGPWQGFVCDPHTSGPCGRAEVSSLRGAVH